ncbi:MAG: hypothetical protein Q8Q18_03810 [bacterium]|nr:hypothetical protein [bacterium]
MVFSKKKVAGLLFASLLLVLLGLMRSVVTPDSDVVLVDHGEQLLQKVFGLERKPENNIIDSFTFREDGREKFAALFVTGTEGDCHGCGVKVGGGVLMNRDGVWEVDVLTKEIGTYGSFGVLGKLKNVSIGSNKKAFQFDWSGLSQGYLVSGLSIVGIYGGVFRQFINLTTNEENGGTGYEDPYLYSYSSIVTFVQGKNPAYYDIAVKRTGTIPGGQEDILKFGDVDFSLRRAVPVYEEFVYELVDGTYQLTQR